MVIGIYKTLITLVFPVLKATYIRKRRRTGKEHPVRFNERLGLYKRPRPEGKLYWMHGASVGEAVSMLPLIDKLLKEDPELSIMVTTGTLTSAEIMAKRLPPRAFHQFIPFDVPAYAKRLLKHFRPDAVLWFESELWPSLLSEIKAAKIPLILVNGRISDKSFAMWKKFKFAAKELLSCFSLCLGQSEQDKNRLIFLGAPKADCFGNIKFAGMPLPVDADKLAALKQAIGERPVFLASSTHHDEEERLALYLPWLKENVPGVLTVVVPRHPHRGQEIAAMYRSRHFAAALRSAEELITPETDIYVADTIGEMGLWYALAKVSFIGGSLVAHGGQNFMEAARGKNAVIVGPNMQNFAEMMTRARFFDAVYQVSSAEDVIEETITLLRDPALLAERQQKAYAWTVKEAAVLDGIAAALAKELRR